MAHTIEQGDDGVTTVRFGGTLDLGELVAAVDDAAGAAGPLRLWDLTGATVDLDADEVTKLAAHSRRVLAGEARVAIVAGDDLAFGLARMYEVHRAGLESPHRIFRSEDEARAWLLES